MAATEAQGLIDDLLDLVVRLLEALDAAHTELVQLAEVEVPLTDELLKQLEERDALVATLRRLRTPAAVEAARAAYREELSKVTRADARGMKIPVQQEVVDDLAATMEELRRRALVWPALGRALNDALLRSTFTEY